MPAKVNIKEQEPAKNKRAACSVLYKKYLMKLTYIYHSCFALETPAYSILFDYYKDTKGKQGYVHDVLLQKPEPLYILSSHFHPDHFSREIFSWKEQKKDIHYLLSKDILRHQKAAADEATFLDKGDVYQDDLIRVQAFGSTDVGVSFLLTCEHKLIFHAGDLNNWHWREESTPREIEEAERDFQQVMETMRGEKVDVAFFPVDPRLGMMFDAGPNYFAMVVKPRLMIPMHFWERAEVIREYARRSRSPQTEIIAMTTPGDMILLEFDEQENMTVHMQSVTSAPVARNKKVQLEAYDGENPFNDSDLPVDME